MSTAPPEQASGRVRKRLGLGRLGRLVARRARFVIIQLAGAATAAFFLIRLVPGDPARVIAGPAASEQVLAAIRRHLGLDQSLPVQYWRYLTNLVRGDLGNSITTGQPVFDDLVQRVPATLELISLAMLVSLLLGIPLGFAMARRRLRGKGKVIFGYAMFSGSIPDFWLALIVAFIFAYTWGILPPPIGRLGFETPPERVTGFLTIDSVLAGDLATLWLALQHLALPVLTLTLVYSGLIVKVANAASEQAMRAGFNDLYASVGIRQALTNRRLVRLALPPVATVAGITYGFLLGGSVLVEQIYSWGGIGQYAVSALRSADFAALQGFIVLAAVFNIVNYLLVDVVLWMVDPRLGRKGSA
ncbi:MAG: ABC transporter permease [bacterium]|nr:ABC transporter permease [bacterium]